jgi:hypothetical protein
MPTRALSNVWTGLLSASAAVCVLFAGCSWTPDALTPDVTVGRWMLAFASLDGETVAGLSCRGRQTDVQNSRFLNALGVPAPTFGAGAGGVGQFGGGGGGGLPVYDVSDLRYATTFANHEDAQVQVMGLLRMATGMVSQTLSINSPVGLKREEERWRVCGPA